VPLEIGDRELDGEVNDVRCPWDLRIDRTTVNAEEGGATLLLIAKRECITGDLLHNLLGDATHGRQHGPR